MKHKLFDFSILMGTLAVFAFGMLLAIFGYMSFTAENPVAFIVLFFVFLLAFVALFWMYVICAPRLRYDSVTQGKKKFAKENVKYDIYYNFRFSEMKLRLRDKTLEYIGMDDKGAKKKKEITVQATQANLKKLGDWLGQEITIPEDVKPKFIRGTKNKK